MNKQILTAAALLALVISGIAGASDIYKWVDEDGSVHYGDKPDGAQVERLAIASQPTDPARVQAQVQARHEARAAATEAKAAAADGQSAEESRATAEEMAEKCASLRATMQRFVTSRRLYREDEAGERVYLDEAEMQAARQRVENQIAENCTP